MSWFRNIIAVVLLSTGLASQITLFGYDKNPGGQLNTAPEQPPPKLGSRITVIWHWDVGERGEEIVVFGPDVAVRANICWYSNHPAHLLDRWLLVPPIVMLPIFNTRNNGPPYSFHIPIDPSLVGEAVRLQVFRLIQPGSGSMCDRLRGTNALRVQFMY
jgi:hypothetical protein